MHAPNFRSHKVPAVLSAAVEPSTSPDDSNVDQLTSQHADESKAETAPTPADAALETESLVSESVVSKASPLSLTETIRRIDSTDVEFASHSAFSELQVIAQYIEPSTDVSEVGERQSVVQTGCRLFCEDPPLRRQCIDLGLGMVSSVIDPCGLKYVAPYMDLTDRFDDRQFVEPDSNANAIEPACPQMAWWEQQVTTSVRPESKAIPIDIESLLVRTLANSKYLQGLADLPLIRKKSTVEAIAEFDARMFMETRFNRVSEPVGNELTVGPGGSRRLRENDFVSSAGVARKSSSGARVEFAQQIGMFNNNSDFTDPRHQGNTQLTLNITQPLLSGAGKQYNTSLIMLAQLDERVAWDQVANQLQDYLVEVTENYWQLYLERARLKQKERHLQRGETIFAELESRREIDAVESQIARIRAAVQTRRTNLIRTQANVRNVESKLRGLVNDRELYGSAIELVPAEAPHCLPLDLTVGDAMSQALQSRSEIDEAIQKVRAAGVRLSVAKNELLPILDVVLESYLSGLRGGNDIGQAWVDQFSVGEPSYSAGIRYEIPFNNRLAKKRHQRRRLEMRQAISKFEFQVETLMSEVDIAVREVDTSYKEMSSRDEAMAASELDLEYFHKRWELTPGDDRSASFLLEDILEAQDRVAAQESNFAQSQVNYAMSVVNLKRALGILIQSEQIGTQHSCHCGLEKYSFTKQDGAIVLDQTGSEIPMFAAPEQFSIEPPVALFNEPPAESTYFSPSTPSLTEEVLSDGLLAPPIVIEEVDPFQMRDIEPQSE